MYEKNYYFMSMVCVASLLAQAKGEKDFYNHCQALRMAEGVELTTPSGFEYFPGQYAWLFSAPYESSSQYTSISLPLTGITGYRFISADGECEVIYTYNRDVYNSNVSSLMINELCAFEKLFYLSKGSTISVFPEMLFKERVKELNRKDACEKHGADNVYEANMPMGKPYREKFTHCLGIFMDRANKPNLAFRILTTDEGYKRIGKYKEAVYGCVKYQDTPPYWKCDDDSLKEAKEKYYSKQGTSYTFYPSGQGQTTISEENK